MKFSFLLCIFSLIILASSCGGDNDANGTPENCSTAFAESFEAELLAVSNASQNFGTDPTPANCQAFKDAYNDYIDALGEWENCANFYNQVAQWEQSLEAARTAVNNIMC